MTWDGNDLMAAAQRLECQTPELPEPGESFDHKRYAAQAVKAIEIIDEILVNAGPELLLKDRRGMLSELKGSLLSRSLSMD